MTTETIAIPKHGSPLTPSPPSSSAQHAAAIGSTTPPTMTLQAFLDRVGAVLRDRLPAQLWIEATVTSVKSGQFGHQVELADAGPNKGATAQLRSFLSAGALASIGKSFGMTLDPALLIGMTTLLLVEPSFSAKWHLQAKIVGLSRDAQRSLETKRIERLRQQLKTERLYDRQRSLRPPLDVTRVAVIHPDGAAGYADIAHELGRWQTAGIVLVRSVPAPFDGERAAAALVAALTDATKPMAGDAPDIILMVRGGGARSGLMMLDAEPIVRAVCRCGIPIVAGLGHAIDRSLVDEAAWASADTPSKALSVLWRLITEPAERAINASNVLSEAALRHLTHAGQALDNVRTRAFLEADRRAAAYADDLADSWSAVRAAMSGADQRCLYLDYDADYVLGEIAERAGARLERAAEEAVNLKIAVSAALDRRLVSLDPGDALVSTVSMRALALIDTATAQLTNLIEAVMASADRRLDHAETDLDRRRDAAASAGVNETLTRGYAVVLDRQGRLIRDRDGARAARELSILFGDGAVAAIVDVSSAT